MTGGFFNVYLSDLIKNRCLQVGCNKHSEVIQPPVKYVSLWRQHEQKESITGRNPYTRTEFCISNATF